MAMEQTVGTRADIQRLLDQFTRGEIDFQALLSGLDQAFLSDPGARRVALELVEKQNPNGTLQRSFFRVVKERIEQQLESGGYKPPRAPRRGMPERSRDPAPPSASQAPAPGPNATRPFEPRPRPADPRPPPEATRPFELTPPPQEEQSPDDATAPFPLQRGRNEPLSPDTARLSPDTVLPSPDETGPFGRTAREEHPGAGAAATSALPDAPPEPRGTPEVASPFSPAPARREDRFVARRRIGGRYGLWERPASSSRREDTSAERSAPAAPSADPELSIPTTPPDPGTIERAMHSQPSTESEPADAHTADASREAAAAQSFAGSPARESVAEVPHFEQASGAPRGAAGSFPEDEPATAARESISPVRSAPPPRTPFTGRQRGASSAAAREPTFVTERRAIAPPRQQPLARIGGILILLLLVAFVLLGPLEEHVPGFAAFVEREIPAAFRSFVPPAAPPPQEVPPEAAPPAVAPSNEVASTEAAAPEDAGKPAEPAVPPAAAPSPAPGSGTDAPVPAAPATTKPAASAGTASPPTKPAASAPASSTTKASTPTRDADGAQSPTAAAGAATPTAAAGPGRFGFTSARYDGRESGGAVAIRIQRRGGSTGAASVMWSTHENSATPGDDYADFGPRIESFASGERERVIYVPLANDDISEPRETFSVELESPEGATLDNTSSATVTIVDDD